MGVRSTPWGEAPDGREVRLFTLAAPDGTRAEVSTYGAALVSLAVPDGSGGLADVVLGFDSLAGYLADTQYMGRLVGRFANRIAQSRFVLDGHEYLLPANLGPHHLHGGPGGMAWRVWDVEEAVESSLVLRYASPHLDQGYPGNLSVRAAYRLEPGALRVTLRASSDRPTPLSLASHAYFNLSGTGDCLGHELVLGAGRYLPTDNDLVPSGKVRSVRGAPLDFTTPKFIGERIDAPHPLLEPAKGYDHYYVLDEPGLEKRAALARDPLSGMEMAVYTTQPGLQFYTGNHIPPGTRGKGGRTYGPRSGFCLETHAYPDTPNRPEFPPAVVRPGEEYEHTTVYAVSCKHMGRSHG